MKPEESNKSESWQARSLRLTLFPKTAVEQHQSWWGDLVGTSPETETLQKSQGLLQQEGPFQNGRLYLMIVPFRIDWLFRAGEEPSAGSSDVATLGMFSEALNVFQGLMTAWLDLAPEASRLAIGAELIQPVDSYQEGYKRLGQYLSESVRLDPGSSSDFFYRINRPRPSRSLGSEVKLNRLSSWSLLQALAASFEVGIGRPRTAQVAVSPTARPACRVEMDLSSPAMYSGTLKKESLKRLFNELMDLAKEIAEDGDVP